MRSFIRLARGYTGLTWYARAGPNKKYYDPRVWVREGEVTMRERVKEACADLHNVDVSSLRPTFPALSLTEVCACAFFQIL